MNLNNLTTEKRNKNTEQIDSVSTLAMLKLINNEDKTVPLAVEKELNNVVEAVDQITNCVKRGGRLVYIGAGTSGRLGVLDASECPPTYGVEEGLVIGIIAGGDRALRYPIEGAEDSGELGVYDLKKINFSKDDALVGIASSGRTPYVAAALEYANSMGAITVSLSCTENSKIAEIAKIKINPVVGPEALTGSTRMKSGTAQKLVLNMITTGLMVKLGKVYGNLMIDVKPSNEKLIERQVNIVMEATSCTRDEAVSALSESKRNSKVAIVMIILKISAMDANSLLEKNDGYVRKVIG